VKGWLHFLLETDCDFLPLGLFFFFSDCDQKTERRKAGKLRQEGKRRGNGFTPLAL
jgi:hypothetical protein